MRFALFPFGSRGDVQPFVGLAVTLRERGHDVVLGTSGGFRAFVEREGIAFAEVGGDIEGWMRENAEELGRRPIRGVRAFFAFLEAEVGRIFDETLAAARGADLVVGASLQQAAPSVAAHLKLPYRTVVYCPQVLPSTTHPPLSVEAQTLPRFVNGFLWWAITAGLNLTLKKPVNRGRAKLALPPVDELFTHLRTAAPIVCSDPPLGAMPSDFSGALHTGALRLTGRAILDEKLEKFLAAGAAPVYVGFGSMGQRDPEGATRAIFAALAELQVRAVVASGWGGLGGLTPPPDVLVIDGAPHDLLFPRCSFIVHHGGAGTTHAAARAGVPQLVVPHTADQYWWGHRVHQLGVGPPFLIRRKLTSTTLAARIRAGLTAEKAEKAKQLQHQLQSVDGNALTADALIAAATSPSSS